MFRVILRWWTEKAKLKNCKSVLQRHTTVRKGSLRWTHDSLMRKLWFKQTRKGGNIEFPLGKWSKTLTVIFTSSNRHSLSFCKLYICFHIVYLGNWPKELKIFIMKISRFRFCFVLWMLVCLSTASAQGKDKQDITEKGNDWHTLLSKLLWWKHSFWPIREI